MASGYRFMSSELPAGVRSLVRAAVPVLIKTSMAFSRWVQGASASWLQGLESSHLIAAARG